MPLKKKIDKLEDVSEAFQEHYTPVDAEKPELGFTLVLEGDAQEKSKISEFRTNNIKLQKEVSDLQGQLKNFEGIDPKKHAKALAALEKIESSEEQQLIADGKIDEVLQNRTQALRKTYEDQISAKSKAYSDLEQQHQSLESKHAKLLIGGEVGKVMAKSKLKPRGTAMEDILNRVHSTFKMSEGKMVAKRGDETLFGPSGSPLTIKEHLEQMAMESSHLFENSGGGGATGDSKVRGSKGPNGVIIVDPSDTKAVARHLSDMASGKARFRTAEDG